jgi:hypothetical protein
VPLKFLDMTLLRNEFYCALLAFGVHPLRVFKFLQHFVVLMLNEAKGERGPMYVSRSGQNKKNNIPISVVKRSHDH